MSDTNIKTYQRDDGSVGIINDAYAVGYHNTALPNSFNTEEALNTMILNINNAITESAVFGNEGFYVKYADGRCDIYDYVRFPENTDSVTYTFPFSLNINYKILTTNIYANVSNIIYSVSGKKVNSIDLYACTGSGELCTRANAAYIHISGYWKNPSPTPYKPILPNFSSDIVTYTNSLHAELKNTKQALDYLLNDEEYHVINENEWLNGLQPNGVSFWHRRGKLLTLQVCARYPNPGTVGTVIYKLPFEFIKNVFTYNQYTDVLNSGAIGISENGDVKTELEIKPTYNVNILLTNIIK